MSDESNSPKPPTPSAVTCTRATPRRGTSYRAFRGEALDPDDPLLAFRPVPHKAPRRNSISPARQRAFIAHLAACGIVTEAARHIGASLEALYKLRHKAGGEEFSAAWDAALDRGIARIEDGALARAIEGAERPIVSGGQLLGWHRVHHEGLVMFFLRRRRPERYGEVPQQELRPGHPLYEKIKREVIEEYEGDEQETLDSIDRFIDDMRVRRAANDKILADWEDANDRGAENGDGGED
jgi:hypothetical protein